VRICVCFTLTYVVTTLLEMPHANLALIRILTTLPPSWGQPHSRIVKRVPASSPPTQA
jgi:hypothetical protein